MTKIDTIYKCDEFYYPEFTAIKGMPEGTVYPLPRGTPLFVAYLAFDEEAILTGKGNPRKHGIFGTHEIHPADRRAAYERLRTYEFHHIHPWMGISINKHSYPVGSTMLIANTDEHGVKRYVPYHCECGGVYKRELSGDFFCADCGLEYSWQADEDNARKTSFFDNLDTSEFIKSSKQYSPEDGMDEDWEVHEYDLSRADDAPERTCSLYQGEQDVGGAEPSAIRAISERLERNLEAWRAEVGIAPIDEVRRGESLHEQGKTTKRVKAQMRKDSVYNSRINKHKSDERKALILHTIKSGDGNTASQITEVTGLHRTTVVRLLKALEESGRLTSVKGGKDRVYEVIP